MKSRFFTIFVLLGFLYACGSAPEPIPTLPPLPTSTASPTLTPTETPTVTHIPTPTQTPGPPSLRGYGHNRGIQIGTYLTGAWFPDPLWQEIVIREFDLAVISAGFYWGVVETSRGQLDFSSVDEQVAWAQANQMRICGHPLLLARQPYIPDWLAYGKFTPKELSELLRNFIVQVINRYKGQIDMYIVVEDAPLPDEIQQDVFYKAFGYEYIDLAFQIAREADPDAILIYNAWGNETAETPTTQLTHEIVERLKSKGLIDGVGFEMHLDATTAPQKEAVIAEMRSYGLPVHVTELDVDLSGLKMPMNDRYEEQARIYQNMMNACLESGVCQSFSLWGIGDKFSWLRRGSRTADPTPFDDNLKPKPAYFGLLEALR